MVLVLVGGAPPVPKAPPTLQKDRKRYRKVIKNACLRGGVGKGPETSMGGPGPGFSY